MSQAAHVSVGVAFALGCVLGVISAGHLLHAWRWPGLPDGTESRYRALAGASSAAWTSLQFGPWLAGWNPTVVLIMTAVSIAPLILSLKLSARASASKRERAGGR
jgi:hypothetical protein